jgi:hypothetical protein
MPATVLLVLLAVQITLGVASYITRVLWNEAAATPVASMVAATVAHVACGALVLVTTVILAIQIHRHSIPDLSREAAVDLPSSGSTVGA